MNFLDLQTPYQSYAATIKQKIATVLEHGAYLKGPEVDLLESKLADYVGVKHCITLSSGTDALLAALLALDIKPGDEVITPAFSFVSVAEMLLLMNAVPVFVDINPRTYNLDPSAVEQAITERTRCIIPASLYGQPANFDAINAVAKRHNIPVVDDAAQSFGAQYKGKKSGALADISCTSFYPTKPLGAYGDGGACFTDSNELAENLRMIREHGQSSRYYHTRLGITGRLDTLQAAILSVKLDYFDQEIASRQAVATKYNQALTNIITPYIAPDCTSVYALYTIATPQRDQLQQHLQQQGIPTAIHYPTPLHQQPLYQTNQSLMHTENAANTVLSLPMHPYLSEEEIKTVINSVNTFDWSARA